MVKFKGVLIQLLFLISFNLIAQNNIGTHPDTTTLIQNGIKKIIIKKGNHTQTYSELMPYFWKSGTDTTVIVEDCIKKTIITKMGYKQTISRKQDCYWEDAEVINKGYLLYNPEREKCYYSIKQTLVKKDDKTTKQSSGSLSGYYTRKLGLDIQETDTIFMDDNLLKEVNLALKQQKYKATASDSIIQPVEVLAAVNTLRANGCQCGDKEMTTVPPVKWSKHLEEVAYNHAKDMYQRKYFSHDTPEGKSPFDRMKEYGLSYGIAGENIHSGSFDGVEAVYAWEKSPGHCANIMDKGHKYVGVARFGDKYCMVLSGNYTLIRK